MSGLADWPVLGLFDQDPPCAVPRCIVDRRRAQIPVDQKQAAIASALSVELGNPLDRPEVTWRLFIRGDQAIRAWPGAAPSIEINGQENGTGMNKDRWKSSGLGIMGGADRRANLIDRGDGMSSASTSLPARCAELAQREKRYNSRPISSQLAREKRRSS